MKVSSQLKRVEKNEQVKNVEKTSKFPFWCALNSAEDPKDLQEHLDHDD